MKSLLHEISKCQICTQFLEHGVRPVMAADKESRIIIIGQAPGIKVHNSGIPWEDKSGDNLRDWMGIEKEVFYNPKKRLPLFLWDSAILARASQVTSLLV